MVLFAHLIVKAVEHKPEETYTRKDGGQGKIPAHYIIDADVEVRRYSRLRKQWKVVTETVELYSALEPPVKQGKATAIVETRLGGFKRDQIEYRVTGFADTPTKTSKGA